MAYLMLLRCSAASLLSAALLLSGCCANNVCDCNDEQADAIHLRFSSGFKAADLDTIIIQRSPLPFNATAKAESVTLIRTAAHVRDSLVLNNNTPFAQAGTTKVNRYKYVIQYLTQAPRSKSVPTTALVIDSTKLRGTLAGNGCCTCYTNTEKTVYVTKARKNSPVPDSAFVVDLKKRPSYIEVTK
jgi:hypothetical protein